MAPTPAAGATRPPAGPPLMRSAAQRRIAVVAVGGVVLTLRTSLHDQLNGRLVVGWLLTLLGLAIVLVGLRRDLAVPRRAAPWLFAGLVALGVGGAVELVQQVVGAQTTDQQALSCRDDVSMASAAGGRLLREGARPYSAYDAVSESQRCGLVPGGTVVRRGVFASDTLLPSEARIQEAFRRAATDPSAPEVERRLAYPGGAVLAGLLGERGVGLLVAIALLAGMARAVRRTPAPLRAVAALALAAQVGAWTLVGDGHADGIAAGLVVGAWAGPAGPLGGLLFGLACGTKQTAWFLAPAFAATVWARGGRRALLRSAAAAAAGFVLLNGWFIATEPSAWFGGILSPATDGLFPLGAGLVGLVTSGLVGPALLPAFTAAMYAVVALSGWLALRYDRLLPGIGAIVAAMALWFGPRSLLEYMAPAGLLAVTVAVTRSEKRDGMPAPEPEALAAATAVSVG